MTRRNNTLATDIYVIVFRAVHIRIYYAMLIATPPKPHPALTGSGTLSVVNINSLATCQDRRRYITGYKRKQRKPGMDYVHLQLACILIRVRYSCI